jgi:hypothetical protein
MIMIDLISVRFGILAPILCAKLGGL